MRYNEQATGTARNDVTIPMGRKPMARRDAQAPVALACSDHAQPSEDAGERSEGSARARAPPGEAVQKPP